MPAAAKPKKASKGKAAADKGQQGQKLQVQASSVALNDADVASSSGANQRLELLKVRMTTRNSNYLCGKRTIRIHD